MKRIITCLFLLISHINYAQEIKDTKSYDSQYNLIQRTLYKADSLGNVSPINNLLNSNKIKDYSLKMLLLREEAYYQAKFYELFEHKKIKDKTIFTNRINEVLKMYENALQQSKCVDKIRVQYDRYDLLYGCYLDFTEYMPDSITQILKSDITDLTKIGLQLPRGGMAIGIHIQRNKYTSLGIDFSLNSFFEGVSTLYDSCSNKKYSFSSKSIFFGNLFNFSYSKFINSRLNDFSFSVLEISSPFLLNITKFGIQFINLNQQKYLYYGPTIGLSFAMFSISFTYNINLTKSSNYDFSKYQFECKFIYPFNNNLKIK